MRVLTVEVDERRAELGQRAHRRKPAVEVAARPAVARDHAAHDMFTFAAAATVLLAVALLGCSVPARRAVAVQPAAVLRDE